MGTVVDLEWREVALSPKDRAVARDSFVREFEKQWNNWSELGKTLHDFEADEDFKLLNFKSFHSWLIVAAPRSRAYCYLVMGRYRELKDDFTEQDLAQIDLDSTRTLKQLSSAVRQDPEIRAAAKGKPKELRQKVQERFPNQHVETIEERTLKFVVSQADVFDEAVQIWKTLNNPGAADEDIVESILVEWLDSPVEVDSPYNRREAARQREAVEL